MADEAEVRRLADALYRRADWDWARNGGPTLTHGWRPSGPAGKGGQYENPTRILSLCPAAGQQIQCGCGGDPGTSFMPGGPSQ